MEVRPHTVLTVAMAPCNAAARVITVEAVTTVAVDTTAVMVSAVVARWVNMVNLIEK